MMTRDTSKRVTLRNGRAFVTRYKRVTGNHLPANVCLRQHFRQKDAPRGRRRRK